MFPNAGFSSPLRRFRLRLPTLLCTALLALCTSLPGLTNDREEQDGSAAGTHRDERGSSYTTTLTADGQYRVKANFHSFGGDPLSIGFLLEPAASRASVHEFGVSVEELDALMAQCRATKGCDQAEFNRHTTHYYREHALRMKSTPGQSPRLYVDVAQVVHRNRARVRPVAAALQQLAAERGHGIEWVVEAAVALVQTGLVYREPATWEDGRKIMGFYPPPRALERGYGDCDTKAALLAAILLNLSDSRMVGVHVPKHYLLGIAGQPRGDQAYITHEGQPYVLVEVAGPSKRRPGHVAHTTQAALERKDSVRVDPIF